DFLIPVSSAAASVAIDPNDWILNYGKATVSYTPGPPKVVGVSPLPGATIASASAPSSLSIVFSDPVTITAGNVGVSRGGTAVPFTFAYNAGTSTATLTFAGPLAPGTYN